MSYILHIETATGICSVSVAKSGKLLSVKETAVANSHSSLITVFSEEVVIDAGIKFSDLSAVCVSMGPGSYTGLRIGVSAAKGFCYALQVPLIGINTLQSMASHYSNEFPGDIKPGTLLCPMIDARRMEVFTAFFDDHVNFVRNTAADIIDEFSFQEILSKNKVIFFGDGAEKCKDTLSQNSNAIFNEKFVISSKGMISLAYQKLLEKRLEDVAYFEPYYLKDFLATTPNTIYKYILVQKGADKI